MKNKISFGLGEHLNSFGICSTGNKVENAKNEKYGNPFKPGDIIGCWISKSGTNVSIRFTVNGDDQVINHIHESYHMWLLSYLKTRVLLGSWEWKRTSVLFPIFSSKMQKLKWISDNSSILGLHHQMIFTWWIRVKSIADLFKIQEFLVIFSQARDEKFYPRIHGARVGPWSTFCYISFLKHRRFHPP